MERSIVKEEWWPVFELQEPNKYDRVRDVPDELVKHYREVVLEFEKVQQEIYELYGRENQYS